MNEALPTGAIMDSFTKLMEKPVIKKKTTNQTRIANLAGSDDFKALQEIIDQWIENIKNIPIDPTKDTVEAIGFRYLASKVTIEYLTDIRNMPENYRKLTTEEKEDGE